MRLRSGLIAAVFVPAAILCLKFVPLPWLWIWLLLAALLTFFVWMERKHLRERTRVICINLIPIFLFFAGAEWVFHRLDGSVATEQDAPYVRSDKLLGSTPIPGSRSHFRMSYHGEKIAEGVVTIDQAGNRVTPEPAAETGKPVVFYGCSFTFGLGISDHETLPWQFAETTGLRVFNLGLNGYGPQQFLALLESGKFSERVQRQTPELVIYLALPCHLERLNGEPSFCATSPRYVLQDGEFRRAGTFLPFDGIPILGICARQALKSPIFCRVYSMLRRSSQDDEERIANFRAAVLKMRDLVKRQLPDARFVVLSYDSPTEVIQRSLAETDIEIIRCSELVEKPLEHADYHIPHDGHPTGALWRDLLPGLLRILDSSRFEPGAVSGQ